MSDERPFLFSDDENYNPNRVGLVDMAHERQELEKWVARLDNAIKDAQLAGDETRVAAIRKSRAYAMSQLEIARKLEHQ